MTVIRQLSLLAWLTCSSAAWAQAPASMLEPRPLDALAHWVGGEWVTTVEPAPGRKVKLIRRYEWSFDKRLLIGRSFAQAEGGRRVQTRETVFSWNGQTRRIEFIDHIDLGGWGQGFIEQRDGQWVMEAQIAGGSAHPPWRAWMKESADEQQLRAESLSDGRWVDYGTFTYRRMH